MRKIEYSRSKRKDNSYLCLQLDENDLVRLARIVQEQCCDENSQLELRIKTSDEEDTFKSSTPDFFTSHHM
ncbi:MAG: hypothetical protein ACKVT0_16945, partial [Planctomycetaceae bacterium]